MDVQEISAKSWPYNYYVDNSVVAKKKIGAQNIRK